MTAEALERGDLLLAEGRWEEAKQAFLDAAAAGETAEAFEGLAHASRWLEDADSALNSMKRAYRLYVERDDDVAAARY